MQKSILLFLTYFLLFFTVNCSNPDKKEKHIQDTVLKEIDKLENLQYVGNPASIMIEANEIKKRAKAINFDLGVFRCNLSIMGSLHSLGKYKEAISIGKENDILVWKIKDSYYVSQHYMGIGTAYSNLGLVDEGQGYLNKALQFNKKVPKSNEKYYQLAAIYGNLAFEEGMRNKSAVAGLTQKYYLKELWAIEQIDNSKEMEQAKNRLLSFLYLNLGVVSNQQNKAKEAEDYFHKALDICKRYKITKETPLNVHNEMSWLLFDQKRYDSCISYAQRGVVLERSNSKPTVRRDLYEVLYKSYSEKRDIPNSEKYMKIYMKLNDSILDAQEVDINEPVKNIVKEKEEDHKNNLTTILAIIGGSGLILAILIFFLWRRNRKILHSKYEKIITELKNNKNEILLPEQVPDLQPIEPEKKFNIHDDTMHQILSKLDKFEKSGRFLKKDMDVSHLAKHINTNPRYLSEIINQYKEKNFSNYINGLRIHHLVQLLYEDPVYREYKIDYLSEYCGFASRYVFGVAFKKETGMTPSYFINQLKDNQKEID